MLRDWVSRARSALGGGRLAGAMAAEAAAAREHLLVEEPPEVQGSLIGPDAAMPPGQEAEPGEEEAAKPMQEEEIRGASVVVEAVVPGAGGEGGIAMDSVETPEKVLIKAEVVVGENCRQKFIEEIISLEAVKIVDIVPSLVHVRSIVKEGKVIVQGTLHKQIYYVGPDNLEHHLAEDIEWSELVEIPPVDPAVPVQPGMNQQDHSYVENLIWEYDPATAQLIQKVILNLCIKVTQTQEISVLEDPFGPYIEAKLVVGHGQKQKFLRHETLLPDAVKIVDIEAKLTGVHSHVKTGKVIVQGTLHKQIYYVGTDSIVHHVAEDVPWSEMVEVAPLDPAVPVREGMHEQDHSVVENLIWEFDPATGQLIQKVIILVQVTVDEFREIPVCLSPYGYFIKTPVVIGRGHKQKFIERTITIPGLKIVDITATLRDVVSIVKAGKVIIQGVLHKQIYFVGKTDGLVHHEFEDVDFSEMVEVTPLNPEVPVQEGMQEHEHCHVENLLWEFVPDTGALTQKVIIHCDVTVTEFQQLHVCDP
ncbi:MAG: DUF3794 domain-containing protein [Thermaerobacter sp.]|nr:DUF3794 domain-containing protein [Thermaerobacter sp.]